MFNKDFYPTSQSMIKKMCNLIDFRRVKTVLEPSGGKGNIPDYLLSDRCYNFKSTQKDIDVIESERELQYILRGKKYRLVHDDFLTFNSLKSYDLIIMNPPFSDGDKHLLKAIEMISSTGGQLVALVNAQTIKNPFTNSRKRLLNQLGLLDAKIEHIEDAFIDSERETAVEVAMIYISCKRQFKDSIILDHLKHDSHDREQSSYTYTDTLISGNPIEGLVERYNNEINVGIRFINDYEYLAKYLFDVDPLTEEVSEYRTPLRLAVGLDDNRYNNHGVDINEFIKLVRNKYWNLLFDSSGFQSLLTTDIKRRYQDKLSDLCEYDFSLFNINQIKYDISQLLSGSLEDTILKLFDELSHDHAYYNTSKNIHLYDGWKTNKAWKINHKVIFPLSCLHWYSNNIEVNKREVIDKLRDIEKVMNYLDIGEAKDIDLVTALDEAESKGQTKKIQLKHFMITLYKKGTCHLEFTSLETLKKFNIFGSNKKGWLPPGYGTKAYHEMSEDERHVIDDYQGQEDYNFLMLQPNKYLFDPSTQLKLTA